ncbi:MAG: hypothetical protein QM791_02910 [Ferruginibacter sp.]
MKLLDVGAAFLGSLTTLQIAGTEGAQVVANSLPDYTFKNIVLSLVSGVVAPLLLKAGNKAIDLMGKRKQRRKASVGK